MDNLDGCTVRVQTVKTARAIAMGARLGFHCYLVSLQEFIPLVHILLPGEKKTDVIKPLNTRPVMA